MIRPMPFCPSFDPCPKLTPVQVKISSPRIQNGGGSVPFGDSYSAGFFTSTFSSRSSSAAQPNPTSGEISSTLKTFVTCAQSTPLVPLCPPISWFAMPTPIIDPISVCELDAGSPNAHVLRFQIIAASNRAKTMAKPAPLPTCRISSTGSSERNENANPPDEVSTPIRFHIPDHTTAMFGSSECV